MIVTPENEAVYPNQVSKETKVINMWDPIFDVLLVNKTCTQLASVLGPFVVHLLKMTLPTPMEFK